MVSRKIMGRVTGEKLCTDRLSIIPFDSIMCFVKFVTCHINRLAVKKNVRNPNFVQGFSHDVFWTGARLRQRAPDLPRLESFAPPGALGYGFYLT